jgi:hypothetical protein
MTAALMTPAEIAKAYRYELSYVYRLASMHGWRRLRYHHWASTRRNGRTYYDPIDIATTLTRA